MSVPLALLVGVLFATGTYLMLHRTMIRIVLGVAVMGNGINLLLIVGGGPSGTAPVIGEDGTFADPVPQALALTAIVIGFALQAFLLALAWRNWTLDGNDEVEDDLSDRMMARRRPPEDPDGGIDADTEPDSDFHPGREGHR